MGPCDEAGKGLRTATTTTVSGCARTVGARNHGGWADHVALHRRDGLSSAEGGLTFATSSPAAVISMWGCCATPTIIAMPTVTPTRWPTAMRVREGLVPSVVPPDPSRKAVSRKFADHLGRCRQRVRLRVGLLMSFRSCCRPAPQAPPQRRRRRLGDLDAGQDPAPERPWNLL